MFCRKPRVAAIVVATVLLVSSTEVRGDTAATACPCLFQGDAICLNTYRVPPCVLDRYHNYVALVQVGTTSLSGQVFANAPRVRSLDLRSRSLTEIRASAFVNNPLLVGLHLTVPYVVTLEPGTFRPLTKLSTLELESSLKSLDEDAFELCPDLNIVRISARLGELRPGTFRKNRQLEFLYLSGNSLGHLPAGLFPRVVRLVHADFAGNGIRTVAPEAFRGLRYLDKLDLSRNELTTLEEGTLDYSVQLEWLVATANRIESLPAAIFAKNENLVKLNLEHNQLKSLPRDIFANTTRLEEVYLPWNRLETLEPGLFRRTPNLSVLDLKGNALTTLPADLFSGQQTFHAFRHLVLSHNRLASLPTDVFRTTPNLLRLELSGNRFQRLPVDVLEDCPRLEYFSADENQLDSLPEGLFSSQPNLWLVSLQHNNFSRLPADAFSDLPSLEVLQLAHNPWDCYSCDVGAMFYRLTSQGIEVGDVDPVCLGTD